MFVFCVFWETTSCSRCVCVCVSVFGREGGKNERTDKEVNKTRTTQHTATATHAYKPTVTHNTASHTDPGNAQYPNTHPFPMCLATPPFGLLQCLVFKTSTPSHTHTPSLPHQSRQADCAAVAAVCVAQAQLLEAPACLQVAHPLITHCCV